MRDESARPRPPYGCICAEDSNEPLIPWLLGTGGQRPCANETASDFDEFPPLHGLPPW
jgi:hypothetical protein